MLINNKCYRKPTDLFYFHYKYSIEDVRNDYIYNGTEDELLHRAKINCERKLWEYIKCCNRHIKLYKYEQNIINMQINPYDCENIKEIPVITQKDKFNYLLNEDYVVFNSITFNIEVVREEEFNLLYVILNLQLIK